MACRNEKASNTARDAWETSLHLLEEAESRNPGGSDCDLVAVKRNMEMFAGIEDGTVIPDSEKDVFFLLTDSRRFDVFSEREKRLRVQ